MMSEGARNMTVATFRQMYLFPLNQRRKCLRHLFAHPVIGFSLRFATKECAHYLIILYRHWDGTFSKGNTASSSFPSSDPVSQKLSSSLVKDEESTETSSLPANENRR